MRLADQRTDILVAYIGCGDLPPLKAKLFCAEVSVELKKSLGDSAKIIVMAQGGTKESRMEVLSMKLDN